ncbi:MAG: molybdenum cofactor guanylyltransferase [Anaerolineales bacterium]|nr:molybdenum cofactor guanylyltransferase [Anaerolineales bacterium]
MVELSVVLQAGGKSSRMGQDKALLPFMGTTMLGYILKQVKGLGDETFIITNQPQYYGDFAYPLFNDVIPDVGALGGLYSAVYHARCAHVFVLGCDMPFVKRGLLDYMLGLTPDFDVVIPRLEPNGFAEPFRAIYKQSCLGPIKTAIDSGQRKVISFFNAVDVRYVESAEIERFDPEHRSFFNVNTPEDFSRAEQMAREG